jgi:hypothetical protein
MEVAIDIEVLHRSRFERDLLDALFRAEFIFRSDSGPQVFQLRLHEAALVARGQVPDRGNAIEIALVKDDHSRSELCRIHHALFSPARILYAAST